MRKIAVDVRMIGSSGIGTYIRNLVPRVIAAYPSHSFYLLGKVKELTQNPWAHKENIEIIDCRSAIYTAGEQIELFRKIPKEMDLFWSPHYNIPLLHRGKLLVTVHDVFHLAMPQFVKGAHKTLYARGMFAAVRRKATAVVCDSQFTADELERLTGCERTKIHIAHLGVDRSWFAARAGERPHPSRYLLYVGNVKPHKNVRNLVRAFGLIMDKVPCDLVIVGKKEGFITGDVLSMTEANDLRGRVAFTGHVDDSRLRQYFLHADALVFPSLYEGFGLPPVEAMACGCPVIVSDTASLPEVCGDAALYCDPHSPEDIAKKIRNLLNDEDLRSTLIGKGIARASSYTWEACVRKTCKVIEGVMHE